MSPARKAVCPVQNRETSAWRPRAERFVLPFSSNLERHHRRVAAIPLCIGHGSLADCGLRSRRWSLGRAHHVDRDCAGCGGTPKLRDLYPRWPQGFRPFFAISCGLALAGCASNSPQRESKAAPAIHAAAPLHQHGSRAAPPMRVTAPAHRYSEQRIRRPDRALLAPQPAPDCEFRGSDDLKPVDPDQWARLKLDYERQCYQKAEQMVRDRLKLLQASRCEIEPVRHSRRLIR